VSPKTAKYVNSSVTITATRALQMQRDYVMHHKYEILNFDDVAIGE